MADLGDLVKVFKQAIDHLEGLNKSAKKIKFDPITKQAKTLSAAWKEVNAEGEDVQVTLENINKAVSKVDYSVWVKGSTKIKSYSKEVQEAEKALNSYYGSVEETYKATKYLNMESNKQIEGLKEMSKGVEKLSKSLYNKKTKLNEVKKAISSLPDNFNKLKESMASVQKSGANKFLDKAKDKLSALQGVVSETQFTEFKNKFAELDNVEFKDLPQAIANIEKMFGDLDFDGQIDSKVKSVTEGISESMRESFDDVKKNVTGSADDIVEVLQSFKKIDAFETLSKNSQNFVDVIIKNINNNAPLEVIEKNMKDFMAMSSKFTEKQSAALSSSFSQLGEKAKQADAAFLELNKKLQQPKELKISLDFEAAKVQDTINSILNKQATVGSITEPEKETLNVLKEQKEVLDKQKTVVDHLTKSAEELGITESEAEHRKKIIIAENKKILKQGKLNNTLAERHLRILEEIDKTGLGEEKIQKISDSFVKAHGHLNKFKEYLDTISPTAGKAVGGVSGFLKTFGDGLMKHKAAVGVLAATVGALESVIQMEGKVKKMFKDVADTGAVMGTSAGNMKSELNLAFKEANNAQGLIDAFRGVEGAMLLGNDELNSMRASIISSGISMEELSRQAKGVTDNVHKTDSALLTAGETAHIFARKLGKSDTEMASMIGDLSYQYGSTLDTIRKGFVSVSSAAATSSMGANKFMGIIQASTAGMALYQDQIEDTAKSLSKMQGIGLTGKEQGQVLKTAAEFAQDFQKVRSAFAVVGVEKMAKMSEGVDKKISDLESKKKEAEEKGVKADDPQMQQLVQEIANLNKLSGSMKKGDAVSAAEYMAFAPVDVQQKLVGEMIKTLKDTSKQAGEQADAQFMAMSRSLGLGEIAKTEMKTGGLVSDVLTGEKEGEGSKTKSIAEQAADVAAMDKATVSAPLKIYDMLKNELSRTFGSMLTVLQGILVAVAAAQSFKVMKDLYSFFKQGGKGGGGAAGGLLEKLLPKVFGKGGAEVAKGGVKSVSSVGKVADATGKSGVLSKAGVILSKATKPLSKLAKAAGPLSGLISFGANMASGEGMGRSAIKAIASTVGGVVGGTLGSFIPVAGTAAGGIGGGLAGDWVGGKIADAFGMTDPSELEPPKLDTPKTASMAGPSGSASASLSGGKDPVQTEKVIKEIVSKSPYAITQHFYGVTDKNFIDQVKAAMIRIEQERARK